MNFDLLELIFQASVLVQLVLLSLVVASVVSWTIIVIKWRQLRGAEQDTQAFLEVYHEESFEEAFEAARALDRSPVAVIFLVSCTEIGKLARRAGRVNTGELVGDEARAVERQLSWATVRESARLERGLTFLATTGSAAPFIGLFGTVVGIIQTFQSIGKVGSASLAVVGPGMAEALVATAVGLVAAIPATIFYNLYARDIDALGASIDMFRGEFNQDLNQLVQEQTNSTRSRSV